MAYSCALTFVQRAAKNPQHGLAGGAGVRRLGAVVAVGAVFALSWALPAVAEAQTCTEAVAVTVKEDACGAYVAVSATGDAKTEQKNNATVGGTPVSSMGLLGGILAASVTGDASNTGGQGACSATAPLLATNVSPCIAASATGNASNDVGDRGCNGTFWAGGLMPRCFALTIGDLDGDGTGGNASNNGGTGSCSTTSMFSCGAFSVAGDASNTAGDNSCGGTANGCVAASLLGAASNTAGDNSCAGTANSCYAGSLGGSATNTVGNDSCTKSSVGCGAFSGSGDASNSAGSASCGAGTGSPSVPVGGASNCFAMSGQGDASNTAGDDSCGSGTAVNGCIASSAAGNATNTAGERSCGSATPGMTPDSAGKASAAGCTAMSGQGDSSNAAGADSCGSGTSSAGCTAAAGGTASNTAGDRSCGSGTVATGCAAVGGEGASNTAGAASCGAVGGTIGGGCVAAAREGEASNSAGAESCGSAQHIIACIAMSGGSASNTGCTEQSQGGPQCIAMSGADTEASIKKIFFEHFGCDSPETCEEEHFGGDGDDADGGGDAGGGGAGGGGGDAGGSGTGTGTAESGSAPGGGTTITSSRPAETDTSPPQTTLRSKKPRLIRAASNRRKAIYAFRFRSSESGSTFECRLDGRAWRRCSSPKRVKVAPGRHTFRVRATDRAGNTDRTPAVSRWRVRKPS